MISNHFDREEFACQCGCGFDTVDVRLLEILERLRHFYGEPVNINSACRCQSHNRSIGSTDTSQHVQGKAADIVVNHIDPQDVYDYLNHTYPFSCGIGRYRKFTHIDSRDDKERWEG